MTYHSNQHYFISFRILNSYINSDSNYISHEDFFEVFWLISFLLTVTDLTASPVVTTLVYENRSQITDSEGTLIFNDDPSAAQPHMNTSMFCSKTTTCISELRHVQQLLINLDWINSQRFSLSQIFSLSHIWNLDCKHQCWLDTMVPYFCPLNARYMIWTCIMPINHVDLQHIMIFFSYFRHTSTPWLRSMRTLCEIVFEQRGVFMCHV